MTDDERYHDLSHQTEGFKHKSMLKHHFIRHLREEAAQAKADAYEDAARVVEACPISDPVMIAAAIRARAKESLK